jgi:hypothetical protein
MSLALYASPYDSNGIDNSTDNLISKKRLNHNKTQKYYNKGREGMEGRDGRDGRDGIENNQSEKVKKIIKSIHDNSLYNDDIEGVDMGDFTPISPPESAGVNRTIDKSNIKENYAGIDGNDNNINNVNNANNANNANNSNNSNNSNNTNTSNNSNNNANYYTIQPNNQPSSRPLSSQNNPNASNYLDSMEYNNLNYNYGDNKSTEEYYKKYSPNYSYGSVSNWNRTSQTSQINNNAINNNINGQYSSFSPSLAGGVSNENSILIDKLNYMIHLLEEQHDERTNNVTEEVVLYCFLGVFMIFIVDSFTRVGKYVR